MNRLNDLMRVFCVLERKPEPDHRNGMSEKIWEATHKREDETENEYFHLKWYLKGTGHVTFKRPDLVEKLNAILAKHYPHAIASELRNKKTKR